MFDTKENKVGTDVISYYDYLVNGIGQRKELATSGTAFPAIPSWICGYDSHGQVTAANSNVNTSDCAYEYDAIGNRKKSANRLTLLGSDNYTANALHQYATIVDPSYDFDGDTTTYLYDAQSRRIAEYRLQHSSFTLPDSGAAT